MSPERGGRKASGKGGRSGWRRPGKDVAARRRGLLLLFGALFLILFVVLAVSEGLGDPSIPSGDVLLVEEAPEGEVSQAEFDHMLELSARQAGQKKAPKPGDPKYDETKESALTSLVEFAWLGGQADEMGIGVSDQKVSKELEKLKKENFPKEAEFDKFVKESGFTPEDVDLRVKFQIVSNEIQEQLSEEAPTPSDDEIEAYYEAAKSAQFTQQPSRDVRLIRNKDRRKAEQALARLEKANTAKDWNKAAKELSEDPATKGSGGLQKAVVEGALEEPLDAAVFDAAEGQLEGPVKTPSGFTVFEVQNSSPESVEELKSVEGQIKSQLSQQLSQESFNEFVADFTARWTARTFCADDYVIERCANFEDDGRPEGAPPACYEEDPKGGRPDGCPAPVFQLVPALPGSVTPLEPQGNQLAQRPHPAGEPKPAGEEGAAGLPPGVVPAPSE